MKGVLVNYFQSSRVILTLIGSLEVQPQIVRCWLAVHMMRKQFGRLGGVMVRTSDLWSRDREFDSRPVYCRVAYVNSAFHPSGVGKSSTSLLAGAKAGRVYLCRPVALWWDSSYGELYAPLSFLSRPTHCNPSTNLNDSNYTKLHRLTNITDFTVLLQYTEDTALSSASRSTTPVKNRRPTLITHITGMWHTSSWRKLIAC